MSHYRHRRKPVPIRQQISAAGAMGLMLLASAKQCDTVREAYEKHVYAPSYLYAFPLWEAYTGVPGASDDSLRYYKSADEYVLFNEAAGRVCSTLHCIGQAKGQPSPLVSACSLLTDAEAAAWLRKRESFELSKHVEQLAGSEEPEPFEGERLVFENLDAQVRYAQLPNDQRLALAVLAGLCRDKNADFVWAERRYQAVALLRRAGISIDHPTPVPTGE